MRRDGWSTASTVDGQKGENLMLSQEHLKWFEERKISKKTLELTGVYSAQHLQNGEHEPSLNGRILSFPYFKEKKILNIKYRKPGKVFYTSKGELIFWNHDVIMDPDVQSGVNPLVITEGEIDALSFIEAGYPFVVSVPNGAPPPRKNPSEDVDPTRDTAFSYIFKSWEELKSIKCIIIATDNDEPGKRLAEELVRRFDRIRCKFVTYPEGCKDANDILVKFDHSALLGVLRGAKPYPVSGIYTFSELPPEPELRPVTTGWGRLDLKLFYPAFMAITGKAGSGKSTWTNQMVAQLAYLHEWPIAIASYEMRIKPFITRTLEATYRFMGGTGSAERWINDYFVFIAPEPSSDTDVFDIDWLIERAITAVVRHGIRVLLIDPWNEIDHAAKRNENGNDYTGRAIRALKRFGREHEVLVIVVAHPNKWAVTNKEGDKINLYDISDTSHFANKADFGVTVSRIEGSLQSNVIVTKVRYEPDTGMKGSNMMISYDPISRTFSQ